MDPFGLKPSDVECCTATSGLLNIVEICSREVVECLQGCFFEPEAIHRMRNARAFRTQPQARKRRIEFASDGTVTNDTYPETKDFDGGFCVLKLPSREAAILWVAKIAKACRCSQELREFGYDPES